MQIYKSRDGVDINFEPGGPPDLWPAAFYGDGAMHWKQELDALIESTLAFANDVRRQPMSGLPAAINTAEQALASTSSPILRVTTGTRITSPTSERDEIRQRISNFRAHQKKMAQDRERYYLQVKAQMMSPTTMMSSKKNPPA